MYKKDSLQEDKYKKYGYAIRNDVFLFYLKEGDENSVHAHSMTN